MSRAAAVVALAVASGILYAAAFPPLAWRGIAWVALVPLFIVVAWGRPPLAAIAGAIFAIVMVIAVASWAPLTFAKFYNFSTNYAWALLIVIGILHAIWAAPLMALTSWCSRRGIPFPLAAGVFWGVLEIARANVPPRNPFYLLGSSLYGTPFVQIADLFGVFGVSALLAAVNASIVVARRNRVTVAIVAAVVLIALAYGVVQESRDFESGSALKVAVVQGGINYEPGAGPENERVVLDRYRTLASVAANGADLVVLPEHAINFLYEKPPFPEHVSAARELSTTDTIVGGPFQHPDRRLSNSVYLVRDSSVIARHDKIRLLAFAEDGWIRLLNRRPWGAFRPGTTATPLRDIGVMICSEALEPTLGLRLSRRGAQILTNPGNDYWISDPGAARADFEATAIRAIENRRYLVRSVASGISAVIDPTGRTRVRSEFGGPAILRATIRRSQDATLYQRWGDTPALLAAVVVLAVSLRRHYNARP